MSHRGWIGLAVGAVLAAQAFPAGAQTALDRLEALDERMNAVVLASLEARIPELSGHLPSVDWDAQMRGAGSCLLDVVEAASGAAGVETLLSDYAAAVAAAEATPGDFTALRLAAPEGMSVEAFRAAYDDCGLLDWLTERLEASGALAILLESSN